MKSVKVTLAALALSAGMLLAPAPGKADTSAAITKPTCALRGSDVDCVDAPEDKCCAPFMGGEVCLLDFKKKPVNPGGGGGGDEE